MPAVPWHGVMWPIGANALEATRNITAITAITAITVITAIRETIYTI